MANVALSIWLRRILLLVCLAYSRCCPRRSTIAVPKGIVGEAKVIELCGDTRVPPQFLLWAECRCILPNRAKARQTGTGERLDKMTRTAGADFRTSPRLDGREKPKNAFIQHQGS